MNEPIVIRQHNQDDSLTRAQREANAAQYFHELEKKVDELFDNSHPSELLMAFALVFGKKATHFSQNTNAHARAVGKTLRRFSNIINELAELYPR